MLGKRILYIDYARSITLFLVIFAHLYSGDSSVRKYIYAFHMPFFFLVSGMLHKDYDGISLIKKLFNKLIVPFGFFLFIGYLFNVIWSRDLALDVIHESIKGVIYGQNIPANYVLWFLLAFYIVRILGNMMIKKPVLLTIFIPLFVFFNYFHINYLYIGSALMALPFYLFGYYTKSQMKYFFSLNYCHYFALLLLLLTITISFYNGKVSILGVIYGNTDSSLLNIFLFYINGLIGSVMLLCLACGVEKELFWLSLPSKCAISIIGLHYVPYAIWTWTLGYNQNIMISTLYSLFVLIICVLFHLLIQKKANWLLGG